MFLEFLLKVAHNSAALFESHYFLKMLPAEIVSGSSKQNKQLTRQPLEGTSSG